MLSINGKLTWMPRKYQLPAWHAMQGGLKRIALCWHRRAGKDDFCLNWAANAAHQRVGTYWHMLPEAAQARKAIWDAVDENSGRRRIDIAFPMEVRETTKDQEMFIRFKNGSTWQVVGSDNFDSLVGSPPVGVVFSEYAIANPRSWDMLRPILRNNKGWGLFVSTPRGKNHFEKLFHFAENDPEWFAQLLTVDDTGVMTPADIEAERRELIATKGEDVAEGIIQQEYYCSFNSPLIGSIYGKEIALAEREGRIKDMEYDHTLPVYTAWDLGSTDDTAIWFAQISNNEIRCIDYHSSNGKTVQFYADLLKAKPYAYGGHWVPHDAMPKTLAGNGRSIMQQLWDLGIKARMVPRLSVQDGIQAARLSLPKTYFDKTKCKRGIDSLREYQREWDDNRNDFRESPKHDWTSHGADSFRYLSIIWRQPKTIEFKPKSRIRLLSEVPFNEIMWGKKSNSRRHKRI